MVEAHDKGNTEDHLGVADRNNSRLWRNSAVNRKAYNYVCV